MSLTFAQIRKYYIESCGNATGAKEESWDHITEGYRQVASRVDVPEISRPDTTVAIQADPNVNPVTTYLDYVELDKEIYFIESVFNVTDGFPCYPEPSGMAGRDRYLQKTTMRPAVGTVRNYWRDGNRMYVRDTPRNATTLKIRYRIEIPVVGDADLNNHPLTPDHYDWAIVHLAAANFYMAHPGEMAPGPDGQPQVEFTALADKHIKAAEMKLQTPKMVNVEEDRPRYERMRLAGYRCSVRRGR